MYLTKRLTIVITMALMATAMPATAGDDDVARVRAAFEGAVAALNSGNLEGFLDTVHDDALSFYSCGPTSGLQGREACAVDWQIFMNTTTGARFETKNEEYRIIGDAGIAYGEYEMSVNYDGQGRQTVHNGRYTMTYTKVGDEWRIIMQHNTPAAEAPQPGRSLLKESR
ncbi:MAG: nuclear transport factor 2 family protein [Acidobacteria bacterium]|nr:nuclear transport factor 2 family protein [Acidobacteriota bacterium]